MTLLSTILLVLIPLAAAASEHWSGISHCGLYQVSGVARSSQKGPVMVVNEKSQSEFSIRVPITNEAKLAPYIDKTFIAKVSFEKKPVEGNYQAVVKEIVSRVPNPLSPKDSGVKILSEAKCKK